MTCMLIDDCGHRPLTYGEGGQRTNFIGVVGAMMWCDRCVPPDVKQTADAKKAKKAMR